MPLHMQLNMIFDNRFLSKHYVFNFSFVCLVFYRVLNLISASFINSFFLIDRYTYVVLYFSYNNNN